MLNRLSTEAIEILKDRPITRQALNMMRRMSVARQTEAARIMVSTGNFSRNFAQALLVATKPEDRVMSGARPIRGLSQEQVAKMQRELECLLNDSSATESYGTDVLRLVIASSYISKLIRNDNVKGYLAINCPEILEQFKVIVSTESLLQPSSEAP